MSAQPKTACARTELFHSRAECFVRHCGLEELTAGGRRIGGGRETDRRREGDGSAAGGRRIRALVTEQVASSNRLIVSNEYFIYLFICLFYLFVSFPHNICHQDKYC